MNSYSCYHNQLTLNEHLFYTLCATHYTLVILNPSGVILITFSGWIEDNVVVSVDVDGEMIEEFVVVIVVSPRILSVVSFIWSFKSMEVVRGGVVEVVRGGVVEVVRGGVVEVVRGGVVEVVRGGVVEVVRGGFV
jgi:hypothetical protein